MSYEKQTWQSGDTITANKLNHMESGIENSGGSSDDNLFVVTISVDGTVASSDKTWREITTAFNAGKIKVNIQLPKLYLNGITPETDPEVLMGIYNGDITVVDKCELERGSHHKSYKDSKVIPIEVGLIGNSEYNYYVQMHRRGYQTPLSGAIKAKSTIYDRYVDNNSKDPYDKPFGIVDENGIPIQYDWLKLGAQEYYRLLHKIKPNMDDIIDNVQKANNGKINKVLGERMNKLMNTDVRGYSTEKVEPNCLSASVQVKPEVVKPEQDLLNAIQVTNP